MLNVLTIVKVLSYVMLNTRISVTIEQPVAEVIIVSKLLNVFWFGLSFSMFMFGSLLTNRCVNSNLRSWHVSFGTVPRNDRSIKLRL